MDDAAALAIALGVGYLPGLALLGALGLRRPLLLLAAAPGASVVVAGLVAIGVAVTGLSYGPLPVGVLTLALGAVSLGLARRRRLTDPGRRAAWVPVLPGAVMVLVGTGYGTRTWLVGMGGLATPPQEHDTIIHAMQTAYIVRSGRAAPWELVPADVLTGHPVSFYPSGFHLLAALVADLTGSVVVGLNAMTVVLLAVVVCTGVAALTAVAGRQLGLSVQGATMAGGVAALVMAGMYRPGFHLMHDGGILSNAASLSMVPGVVAALLALPALRWRPAAGVGVAAAGAAWVHPSAVASIGVTVLAWWLGQAAAPGGRRRLRGIAVPLLAAGGAAFLVLVPAVGPGLGRAGGTGAFPPDTDPVTFRDALGSTFGFPYSGWLDQAQARSQVWAVLLLVLGVAAVIALRRGLGPVAAWASWSAITMGAWLSPGTGFEAPITGLFYNAMLRTWSHVSLLAPVLAGLGVVLVAHRIAVPIRRRVSIPTGVSAVVLVAAAFLSYALVPAARYGTLDEESVATRYRTPDFVRVGADDERAIAWLAERVAPGERVFNSPNDGSTYLYVERGVPVVNVYTLGLPEVPYTYRLLADFNAYPTDDAVRRQLSDLNVRWVYVDSSAPGIGSVGSPEGWAGTDGFTLAPGLAHLDDLPGLRREFRSGTVSVYSLDLLALTPSRP